MNELELFDFGVDLFKQKLITKVELNEFKAQEKAINELFSFKENINEKRKIIELRKLEILNDRLDYSNKLISKIKRLNTGKCDNLSKKKEMLIGVLDNFIQISNNEIMNYNSILPLELKKKLNLKIEYKK